MSIYFCYPLEALPVPQLITRKSRLEMDLGFLAFNLLNIGMSLAIALVGLVNGDYKLKLGGVTTIISLMIEANLVIVFGEDDDDCVKSTALVVDVIARALIIPMFIRLVKYSFSLPAPLPAPLPALLAAPLPPPGINLVTIPKAG